MRFYAQHGINKNVCERVDYCMTHLSWISITLTLVFPPTELSGKSFAFLDRGISSKGKGKNHENNLCERYS